jgi:dipeptidyl aminopeptidase/acylaminoacyl peptidase
MAALLELTVIEYLFTSTTKKINQAVDIVKYKKRETNNRVEMYIGKRKVECRVKKRGVVAEDLYRIKSVTDPQLSPDGKELLYVQTTMNEEKNEYQSHIFYMDLEARENVQWTHGEHRNMTPRWSPDGKKIVFVSNRTGKNQLFLLPKYGGEAKQLTFFTNGAQHPVWSPCGTKIACSISIKEGESLEEGHEQEKELQPIEVEWMKYKQDGLGMVDGSRSHIVVIDIETGEVEQITEGDTDFRLQSWSPDGRYIAYVADQSEDKDVSFHEDVYLYDRKTNTHRKLTNASGFYDGVTWSKNGQYLTFIGHQREFENATLSRIWLYNWENEELQCFTSEFDAPVGNYLLGDVQQGIVTPGVLWADDHHSFYFMATDRGNTGIYYGSCAGEIYPALLESQYVYGFTLDAARHRGVVAISTPTDPGDLYFIDFTTGEKERLTDVNKEWKEEVLLSEPEDFEYEGAEGWTIHGWLMKPARYKEGEKYPLVLQIHGGPHMMYGFGFFHEFQLLASQGYAVLYVNPRGSHGYGQTFVNAVRGDYGGNDYVDLMKGVDYVLSRYSFIDEERLGVTGGSYGGFMTNWIVAHTNRFKAAVTQRSISNWISFYGVSDIGYYFSEWQIGGDLDNMEKLWKHSPLAYVNNVETPLLILHSEKDFRCPIEQAEQLFIALKRKKKVTKFIRFPESNHDLSRSGKPSLRIKRLHYICEWFQQYLVPKK